MLPEWLFLYFFTNGFACYLIISITDCLPMSANRRANRRRLGEHYIMNTLIIMTMGLPLMALGFLSSFFRAR